MVSKSSNLSPGRDRALGLGTKQPGDVVGSTTVLAPIPYVAQAGMPAGEPGCQLHREPPNVPPASPLVEKAPFAVKDSEK
jgi:hypothetical protein